MKLFLDANVLMSRTLRDWFALCAIESRAAPCGLVVELGVSEDVLSEWQYRLRRRHPEAPETAVGGLRRRFLDSQPESILVTGYDVLATPDLNDIDDRHVIAAATHCQADYLVTDDQGILDASDLLEPEPATSEEMLCLIARRDRALITAVARRQLKYWGEKTDSKLLHAALSDAGAPQFAAVVQKVVTGLAKSGCY